MNSKLFSLKQKVIFCKKSCDVARELFAKFQHDFGFQISSVEALALHLIEVNDLGFKKCLMIECCPYCELGFSPMWSRTIASCKHLYHCWCVDIHFNTLSKCIHLSCEEEMHEVWWDSFVIMKPNIIVMFEHSLKAPRLVKVLPKHYASEFPRGTFCYFLNIVQKTSFEIHVYLYTNSLRLYQYSQIFVQSIFCES